MICRLLDTRICLYVLTCACTCYEANRRREDPPQRYVSVPDVAEVEARRTESGRMPSASL